MAQDQMFLVKDISGRGYSRKINALDLLTQWEPDLEPEEFEELSEWVSGAEQGDEYTELNNVIITCIN